MVPARSRARYVTGKGLDAQLTRDQQTVSPAADIQGTIRHAVDVNRISAQKQVVDICCPPQRNRARPSVAFNEVVLRHSACDAWTHNVVPGLDCPAVVGPSEPTL